MANNFLFLFGSSGRTEATVWFLVWGQPLGGPSLVPDCEQAPPPQHRRGAAPPIPAQRRVPASISLFRHEVKRKPLVASGLCVTSTGRATGDHGLAGMLVDHPPGLPQKHRGTGPPRGFDVFPFCSLPFPTLLAKRPPGPLSPHRAGGPACRTADTHQRQLLRACCGLGHPPPWRAAGWAPCAGRGRSGRAGREGSCEEHSQAMLCGTGAACTDAPLWWQTHLGFENSKHSLGEAQGKNAGRKGTLK